MAGMCRRVELSRSRQIRSGRTSRPRANYLVDSRSRSCVDVEGERFGVVGCGSAVLEDDRGPSIGKGLHFLFELVVDIVGHDEKCYSEESTMYLNANGNSSRTERHFECERRYLEVVAVNCGTRVVSSNGGL